MLLMIVNHANQQTHKTVFSYSYYYIYIAQTKTIKIKLENKHEDVSAFLMCKIWIRGSIIRRSIFLYDIFHGPHKEVGVFGI